jgi:hypothetical protein
LNDDGVCEEGLKLKTLKMFLGLWFGGKCWEREETEFSMFLRFKIFVVARLFGTFTYV